MKPQTQRNIAKVLILTTALTLAGCGGKHALQAPGRKFSKHKPAPEAPLKGGKKADAGKSQNQAEKLPNPFETGNAAAPTPGAAQIPENAALPPVQFPGVPFAAVDNTSPPWLAFSGQAAQGAAALPIEMPGTSPVAADQTSSAPVKAGKPVGGVKFQMPDFVKRALAWLQSTSVKKAPVQAAPTNPAPKPAKAPGGKKIDWQNFSPYVFGGAVAAALAILIITIAKMFSAQPKPKAVPTEPPLPEEQVPQGPKRAPKRRKA